MILGSLFDERTKHWNVANLDNLLNRLKLKKKIPGVNTPYLYFGAWRASVFYTTSSQASRGSSSWQCF